MNQSGDFLRRDNTEASLMVLMLQVNYGCKPISDIQLFLDKNIINYEKFFKILEDHSVEGIIQDSPLFVLIPGNDHFKIFKEKVIWRARFNLVILNELLDLDSFFKKEGFEVIFYKGLLLGKLLFGDLTTRITSDIDILIRSSDFIKIRNALLQKGYEELYFFPDNYLSYYLKVSREATFIKKVPNGLTVAIEVQWAPLPKMFGLPYHNDYFFKHVDTIKLSGQDIPTLNLEQHLLIILLHHGVSDLWRNFKHVFDLAMFIKKYENSIDWPVVKYQIEQWKIDKYAGVGFLLCKDIFGCNIADIGLKYNCIHEKNQVLKSLLSYPLISKKKKNLKNASRQILLANGGIEKGKLIFGYLNRIISPSLTDLQNLNLPKKMFPLYYFTKHLRFIFKK